MCIAPCFSTDHAMMHLGRRGQIGINGNLRWRRRHGSDFCVAPDLLLGLLATCGLSLPRGLRYPPVPTTPSSVRFISRTMACVALQRYAPTIPSAQNAQRMECFPSLSQVGPILMYVHTVQVHVSKQCPGTGTLPLSFIGNP